MRRVTAVETEGGGVFAHDAVDRVGVRAMVLLVRFRCARATGSAPVVVLDPTAIVVSKALLLLIAHLSVRFLP